MMEKKMKREMGRRGKGKEREIGMERKGKD